MIHVKKQAEPASFTAKVGDRGAAWLTANPASRKKRMPAYWRDGAPELRKAYKGVCAYFCCYVQPATGGGSTDHFVPKSHSRATAYKWDNYRFACSRMNSRKRDARDVVDPFTLADDWFELYFPTMRVRPSRLPKGKDLTTVKATIKRLNLNSTECVEEREGHWNNYSKHGLSAERLGQHAPFIAMEAARQGLLKPVDQGVVTVASIRKYLDS